MSIGELKVGGINIKDYEIKVLKESIVIVLQKNVLFTGTIESNLNFGNKNATLSKITEVCDVACALEFIQENEGKFKANFEQGGRGIFRWQKQRLSNARTILKKPKVLISDDSTSAVDTKIDAKIRDDLKIKLPNTSKIINSQSIIWLKDCDKIIIMDNGSIVVYDTENYLKNCDIYKDIMRFKIINIYDEPPIPIFLIN